MSTERPTVKHLDGSDLRVAIAWSRFNEPITRALLDGATRALRERHVAEDRIESYEFPGAFELPLGARRLAGTHRYDVVIALGAVIRGDTDHYDLVAEAATRGLQQAALETDVPVIFGVLACDTLEQAEARSGGALGNSGEHAAVAALETVRTLQSI